MLICRFILCTWYIFFSLLVMRLFLMGMQMKQPVIMDTIRLPCLRILQQLVRPDGGISKKVSLCFLNWNFNTKCCKLNHFNTLYLLYCSKMSLCIYLFRTSRLKKLLCPWSTCQLTFMSTARHGWQETLSTRSKPGKGECQGEVKQLACLTML